MQVEIRDHNYREDIVLAGSFQSIRLLESQKARTRKDTETHVRSPKELTVTKRAALLVIRVTIET